MNTSTSTSNMHPLKKFIVELFSVRAGVHIKQEQKG